MSVERPVDREEHDIPHGGIEDSILNSAHVDREIADPVVTFINNYWRIILVIAAAILAGVYVRNAVLSSRIEAAQDGGDALNRVRTQFGNYVQSRKSLVEAQRAAGDTAVTDEVEKKSRAESLATAEKGLAESRSSLEQAILSLGDSRAPYKDMARIYRGALAREEGNIDEMRATLGAVQPADLAKLPDNDRMISEFGVLSYARALLDEPDRVGEGRALLASLADYGTVTAASAALALSRVATTDEEKALARVKLESVRDRIPESSGVLSAELARYR